MSPRATVTSSPVVRTVSSVPSTPTAVVTPPSVSRLSATGGTRRLGTGLAAAARQVHVAVDQARDHPPAAEVELLDVERMVERRHVAAGPQHLLAAHDQVPASARRRIVQLGVPEQRDHRRASVTRA